MVDMKAEESSSSLATPNGNNRDADLETVPTVRKPASVDKFSSAGRINLDGPLQRLEQLLKENWSRYQQAVTDLLSGRLTRAEFEAQLAPMVVRGFARLHNEIMMGLYANSFRDPPPAHSNSLGWSKKKRDAPRSKGDPQAKRLKTEIMSLTNRERTRIKAILKETSNDQPKRMPPTCMIETTFAKLPRFPISSQKINSAVHQNDIIKGFHVPLCSESMQMPETETLRDRLTAIALEHGLLNGVATDVPDMLLAGLEIHLRNILSTTITKLRTNRSDGIQVPKTLMKVCRNGNNVLQKQEDIFTIGPPELALAYNLAPYSYSERPPPLTRLLYTVLDDTGDGLEQTIKTEEKPRADDKRGVVEKVLSERVQVAQLLDGLLA